MDDETPLKEIAAAALEGKKPKEPVSTKVDSTPDTNFAYVLDKATTEINDYITEKQADYGEYAVMPILGCKEGVKLYKTFSPLELKMFKKEFMRISKLKPPESVKQIPNLYVTYINSSEETHDDY